MTTELFGASDDLIELRGDIRAECYYHSPNKSGDEDAGNVVICSDGTLLHIRYGKESLAVWSIVPLHQGSLFDRVDPCFDEDSDRYSDTAWFRDGLTWAYIATEWERIR